MSSIAFQLIAVTVTKPTAPAAINAIPRGMPTPERHKIMPRTKSAALTTAVICPISPCNSVIIVFQFSVATVTSPTAPAASRAIPSGKAAPEKTRIAPNIRRAVLTIAVIVPTLLCKAPTIASQFSATAVASDTAPAIIKPIPRGKFAPENVNTAPSTNSALPSSKAISETTCLILIVVLSQLIATVVAINAAPAIIRPIPSGIFAPENVNRAPITSRATESISKIPVILFCISVDMLPQLSATAAPSALAPTIIRPIPRGMFAPENARIAPTTNDAPPTSVNTCVIAPSNGPSSAPQFSAIMVAKPTAPAAIKASPSGMFIPENVRIAPRARSAPLIYAVNSSIFCLYSTVEKSSKIGFIPSVAPAPPEIVPLPDNLLIVSKEARAFPDFFAASPTLSIAFDSL